ncbi:MAG TPA: c-type cytochrome, partial [Gemmatimonadaceae bacterium]|nr:c-type cytochrome [Gemmatimonadaceae bacterium]
MRRTVRVWLIAGVAAACVGDTRAEQAPAAGGVTRQAPADSAGRFVAHPEHIQPGLASQKKPAALRNPYEGDKRAIELGSKLFIGYNCIDCHGADGAGAMGPSFQDGRWHFGGSAGEVFQSIYEGRPEGMPAWGGRIGDDQIWM